MGHLRGKVREAIQKENDFIQNNILKLHKDEIVGQVSVQQVYGGMRGVLALACNTSYVDPDKGLYIHDKHISELDHILPEEAFYLLLTGELPDSDILKEIQDELYLRSVVPDYVWNIIRQLPKTTHPMTMLSIALTAMEGQSNFKSKYSQGLLKKDFWEATFDDALDLIGMLPRLAAGIYHYRYYKPNHIEYDPKMTWGENYANMLNVDDPDKSFAKLINLFFTLHCDHEGGNVSAFTSRVVNSALSNIYLSTAAGLNGLAGPLHGLANQEALIYILAMIERYGGVPKPDQIREYLTNTLEFGKVIPGYGHAVLRNIDPRFTSCMEFGKKYCSEDMTFRTVNEVFKIAPDILKKFSEGKVKNPWPNVDAISGSLLYRYNFTQFDYYTVLFGVSRIIGFCAQAIVARGLNAPILRPKSITNEKLIKLINAQKKVKTEKEQSKN